MGAFFITVSEINISMKLQEEQKLRMLIEDPLKKVADMASVQVPCPSQLVWQAGAEDIPF